MSQYILQCIELSTFLITYSLIILWYIYKKTFAPRQLAEPRSKNNNIVVSIEGSIGSGKSTLLNRLRRSLINDERYVFVDEPVGDWEMIKDSSGKTMVQKFYEDSKKYAFSFQIMAFMSRLRALKKALNENTNRIIICERSLYTDKLVFAKMLYNDKMIEDVNYQIYLDAFADFSEDCPLHKIIYVNTQPSICFDRIKKRSRVGEHAIPIGYLQSCHDYHEDMMKTMPIEKLVLDGDQDIFQSPKVLPNWIEDIRKYIDQP